MTHENSELENLKLLNQEEVNTLYEMLEHLTKMLDKYAISYLLYGGTLLGAIRHGGLIPWDDDCDLTIDKKDVPLLIHLTSIFEGINYTLKYASGKKYLKLIKDDLWIDIFISDNGVFPQKYRQWANFDPCSAFPSVKCKFGNIDVKVPKNSNDYLDKCFKNWDNIAVIHHSHKLGKSRKYNCLKLELTEEMRQPYLPDPVK